MTHPEPQRGAEAKTLPLAADLKAVFFDFDGVILESAEIKDEAFRKLFSSFPGHVDQILAHHRQHLGRSRFEKFEWIYRELFGRALQEEESDDLGRRFSAIVSEHMSTCPFVPGAQRLLDALHGHVDCFVVSATPQAELDALIVQRELSDYFVEVRGYPPAKKEVFRDLLVRYDLTPDVTLAIGDGVSDYEAANAFGVRFVARDGDSSRQDWSVIAVPTVKTLDELMQPLGLDSGYPPAGRL